MRIVVVFALFVSLVGCGRTQGARCKTEKDCGGGSVCLPTGHCADACASASQCDPGQRCSTAGGCVTPTGCGADADCQTGQICDGSGQCAPRCDGNGSCLEGALCLTNGHCSNDGTQAGTGGVPGCGGQLFEATHTPANFMIVLDHSGSMKNEVGGQPKWTAAVNAVKTITTAHDAQIRFGLELFSTVSPKCDPGAVKVPIGDQQSANIAQALPASADGNGTPIGAALGVAAQADGLYDPTRSDNVLLVTDGKENCNGDPVAAVKTLFSKGVKTYVVGFGGEVNADNLSQMATEGGTALAGAVKYYQADDPTSLDKAFDQIAQGAMGCDLSLKDPPPDVSKIYVYVDGTLQPHDPLKQNGWEYNAATQRLTLYGSSCQQVSTDANPKVNIVYGCPDSNLGGGTGGGGAADGGADGGPAIN